MSSVARLKSHPYINFYQAKAIYESRSDSTIDNFEEVLLINRLDTNGFCRLDPYFDYNLPASSDKE